jgi:imidazolonepropionase-like amidohydrolase
MYVLRGRVIDGNGGAAIENGVVVVEGNRIKAVCEEGAFVVPEDAEVLAVSDATIMPGFIEQHVHLGLGTVDYMRIYTRTAYEKTCQAVYDMERLLEAGFTSVREVGGFANYLSGPIEQGLVSGPRICAAGKIVSQTGGHGDFIQKLPVSINAERNDLAILADGVDEVRKACRLSFRSGGKFIKTMTTGGVTSQGNSPKACQYSMSEIRAMVEEAELKGSYVATHAQTGTGIKNALKGGIKSIEHGMELDDECIDLFHEVGAWLVPTFTIVRTYLDNIGILPPYAAEKVAVANENHLASFRKAYKAGVKIGFGADLVGDKNICPYGMNGMEFVLLNEAGMTPMEAIVAATKTGSELIMMEDELGTLEEGKLADITVCEGNPLEDISILADVDRIKLVMLDGKPVKRVE